MPEKFNLKYDGKKSKIISDDIFDILESIEKKSEKILR